MKKKKILPLLLAAVMLLGILSACRNDNGNGDEDPGTGVAGPGIEQPPETPGPGTDITEGPGGLQVVGGPATGAIGYIIYDADGNRLTREQILSLIEPVTPSGELVSSTVTVLQENFMFGFDTSASGEWIRDLLHGNRGTTVLDREGGFHLNPMVTRDSSVETHANGDRTYTLTIYTDNLWSDGTNITAQDYVFNIMLRATGEWRDIGGSIISTLSEVAGFADFREGDSPYLRGVRLLSEDTFSVTIEAEWLPNVWEIVNMGWDPLPLHDLAPGVTIIDSPDGVRFSDGFNLELVEQTINNPGAARYAPRVTAGPYVFVNYDSGSDTVVLEVNPLFSGTFDGYLPRIQRLAWTHVIADLQIDALRTRQVDMLPAVRQGPVIQAGWNLVAEGDHFADSYPRNGFGYVGFHADHGPVQFVEVRQAIGWLMDRMTIAHMFTGGWGFVQHGWYALTSWEMDARGMDLYNHPDFIEYTFNPTIAAQLLTDGGWVYNADGSDFRPGEDPLRHKMVDDELMPLHISWASNDNAVSVILRTELLPHAETVGMLIEERPFAPPTNNIPDWQRRTDTYRDYHMFTLAVGMGNPFAPWLTVSLYPEHNAPGMNNHQVQSWEMHNIAWAMRAVDSTQEGWREQYLDLWMDFQLIYNQLIPILPLYADEDHDFVHNRVRNWKSDGVWDWRHAIIRTYVVDG